MADITIVDDDIEFGRKGNIYRLWHDQVFNASFPSYNGGILTLRGEEDKSEERWSLLSDGAIKKRRPKGIRPYDTLTDEEFSE